MMAFSQPYFHGIHIKATWDGEINHAVDLDISLNIEAVPNSRLRLISLEPASHAEMTGINEDSPAAVHTGGASTFQVGENQEMEPNKDRQALSATTSSSLATPSPIDYVSRIPLPMSSRGSSPQKQPLPIAQRPPWRSPFFKDATKAPGRSSRNDGLRSIAARPADGSSSPTKSVSQNSTNFDLVQRGREVLKAEMSRRASYHALSGCKTTEGTPEQKVNDWLDQNNQAPNTTPDIIFNYNTEDHGGSEHLTNHSIVVTEEEEHDKLLPSPTSSSQAVVPWTSVRYRNPLRLRGAGSCAASIEKIDGYFYAVFPADVMQVVHRVKIRARVSLRKDPDTGGVLLEIPGFPTQDKTEGCFTLFVLGDDDSEGPTYMKIAHVDKGSGPKVLTGPRLDIVFNLDSPFSIKLLCFENGVRELSENDFEIDYDVRTISTGHLVLVSFRVRDFMMWADSLRMKIFVSGGPFNVLRTTSVNGSRQTPVIDQCKNSLEREVTVTIKAAEITETFAFVCEGRPGTIQHWAPRISRSRRWAEDIRAQRENTADVHNTAVGTFRLSELKLSEVASIYQLAGDISVPEKSSHQVANESSLKRTASCVRSCWYMISLLIMAYLMAYYLTTRFDFDRESIENATGRIVDSLYSWSDVVAKISEWPPGYNVEIAKETIQQMEEEFKKQDERTEQVGKHSDEDNDNVESYKPAMQELSLRDKIDRALGWKGPTGDW